MRVHRGITRTVWLVGRWAIKFPSMRYAGTFFLKGCLANLEEAWHWNDMKDKREVMAPVRWCGWFGLFLVMDRAEPLDGKLWTWPIGIHGSMDCKPENLGWINGKTVWIDYA